MTGEPSFRTAHHAAIVGPRRLHMRVGGRGIESAKVETHEEGADASLRPQAIASVNIGRRRPAGLALMKRRSVSRPGAPGPRPGPRRLPRCHRFELCSQQGHASGMGSFGCTHVTGIGAAPPRGRCRRGRHGEGLQRSLGHWARVLRTKPAVCLGHPGADGDAQGSLGTAARIAPISAPRSCERSKPGSRRFQRSLRISFAATYAAKR